MAVGAIAISSELRSPVWPTRFRSAAHRACWVTSTSHRSGWRSPAAARVRLNAGCGPYSSARSAEASSAVR